MQSRGIRHLDDCRLTVYPENRLDGVAEWSANDLGMRLGAALEKRCERPLSAVRHRNAHDLEIVEDRTQTRLDLVGDRRGVEAILEFVRSDDDAQRRYFVARCSGTSRLSCWPSVTDSPLI